MGEALAGAVGNLAAMPATVAPNGRAARAGRRTAGQPNGAGHWQKMGSGRGAGGSSSSGGWSGSGSTGRARAAAAPASGHPDGSGNPQGWRDRLAGAGELILRELAGATAADSFGFDPEFNTRVLIPLGRALYHHWFQVRMQGLEHVPGKDAALVVANHSGTVPLDAIMLQTGLHDEHPDHRNVRLLGADLVYRFPLLGTIARKGGHTPASPANADALLRAGELVGVFPEGFKGVGKRFTERYHLQRFGRGGFAATAIRAQVPIIPCAIVGAEETYPMIGDIKPLARLFGLPYFPVTPLFPWLGPLGAVPLPSRWIIEFCPPVATTGYSPGDDDDPAAVADLSGRIRGTVQRKLDDLLPERGPAFGPPQLP